MRSKYSKKLIALTITNLILFIVMNFSVITFAYLSSQYRQTYPNSMDIRLLFGHLDPSANPSGEWGSDTNPFLISENRHLQNLYVLQNRSITNYIDSDSVFQVSDIYGNPNYIGGESTNSLLDVDSIGTEQFPFISNFRGVQNPDMLVTLPTGEKSDTSVLGNIRVTALTDQTDIGLFGNIGPSAKPDSGIIGSVSTLLLYNLEINTSITGGHNPTHDYFVTGAPYETNHMGILAGHVQYSRIEDISVYYSGPDGAPTIKAFKVNGVTGLTPPAKYTTATGIVGYYKEIILRDTDVPVSSDGIKNEIGGGKAGLDLGVVYTSDLWEFMEEKTQVGNPAPNDSYDLQTTFGPELYKVQDNSYFQIGVFSFAHSMQVTNNDSLSKLWTTPTSNKWTVSRNNGYSNAPVSQPTPASKYTLTRITNTQMENQTTSQREHVLNSTLRTSTYRYMLTVVVSGKEYALVRNGATAAAKEIDPNNFIIPDAELDYYTFEPYYDNQQDSSVPPYESDSMKLIDYRAQPLTFNQNNTTTNLPMQFLGYGKNITKSGVIKEIPRPLRILYQNPGTSTSFMATSTSSGNYEGVRFIPVSDSNNTLLSMNNTRPNATAYSQYVLQRRFKRTTNSSSYMTFTLANGFSATNTANSGTRVRLYAVNTATKVSTSYNKQIYTPTTNLFTYDTDKTVLFYTGTPSSNTNNIKYRYEMRNLEDLEWSDNENKALVSGDYAIKMASPTSYYYLNSKFWGVNQGIPNPGGNGTINVPDGSIGFTVQPGDGGTSKVFIIVATDPLQDVDQVITVSRFGTGDNQNSDRTIVDQFVLPPVPGGSAAATIPIRIIDGVNNYDVYPNQNTLLVAYIISVPIRQVAITYFLESSQGSASFVYLSSERTAVKDNNPNHENDVNFNQLTGIDFVRKGTADLIATINSQEYQASLTAPYFGVTRNPDNLNGENPNLDLLKMSISVSYDFTYQINRGQVYDNDRKKYINTIFVTVEILEPSNVTGNTDAILKTIMQNYNYNFTEWSYLDTDIYEYIYSDQVIIKINNKVLDWLILI